MYFIPWASGGDGTMTLETTNPGVSAGLAAPGTTLFHPGRRVFVARRSGLCARRPRESSLQARSWYRKGSSGAGGWDRGTLAGLLAGLTFMDSVFIFTKDRCWEAMERFPSLAV